jgi:hypothetical protein
MRRRARDLGGIMMCSEVMDQLVRYLLAHGSSTAAWPPEIERHIAGCPACLAALAEVSSAVTGEPSRLRIPPPDTPACQDCEAVLPSYVEDEVAGRDVARLYPEATRHLASCADCRQQHDLLCELMAAEDTAASEATPRYLTYAEWFQSSFWEPVVEGVHRLVTVVPILIGKAVASFGILPPFLTPQLAPAVAYRGRQQSLGADRQSQKLLKLPCRESDLTIQIIAEAWADNRATLVVAVNSLASSQAIRQAAVELFDEGGRLERSTTDANGLVTLKGLEMGQYRIVVHHGGQSWEIPVDLEALA